MESTHYVATDVEENGTKLEKTQRTWIHRAQHGIAARVVIIQHGTIPKNRIRRDMEKDEDEGRPPVLDRNRTRTGEERTPTGGRATSATGIEADSNSSSSRSRAGITILEGSATNAASSQSSCSIHDGARGFNIIFHSCPATRVQQ